MITNHAEAFELALVKQEQSNLARAYIELRKRVKLCSWTLDEYDGSWDTGCGNKFCIENGTPQENKMLFCCYCGASLVTPNV